MAETTKPRNARFPRRWRRGFSKAEAVVDDLLAHAFNHGAVAVSGRVQPEFADALLSRRSVFLRVNATLMDTKIQPLRTALHAGLGLVTGLAGETWTQLVAGAF